MTRSFWSKTHLVNWKLSPKLLLGHSSLSDIRAIDAYIYWSMLFLLLPHSFYDARLPFSLKRTWFFRFSFYLGGLVHFAIMWSLDSSLKHLQGGAFHTTVFQITSHTSVLLLLSDYFEPFFWRMVSNSTKGLVWKIFALTLFLPQPQIMSRF